VPEEVLMSEVPMGSLLLAPGEQNPEGEEVLVNAEVYEIDRKKYDLSTVGYLMQAVVRDGQLIPKLRKSRGQERYVYTRLVKQSPRHKAERVGELCMWWPMTERTWEEEANTSDSFVDEALNVIEEIGDEITEDFVLPNQTLEYFEEEENDYE